MNAGQHEQIDSDQLGKTEARSRRCEWSQN